MGEKEELDNLAKALVNQGLAASYNDGLAKAKEIMGIKEVIEKKRKGFFGEDKRAEEAQKIDAPKEQETKIDYVKEEVPETKPQIKEPEAKEEAPVIEEKTETKEESKEEKTENKKDEDVFQEEKKIDISEVFDYNKR